jgi:hypothetical protein
MRYAQWMLVLTLGTVLAAGLPDEAAAAKRPKSVVTAIVGGHRVKFAKRTIEATARGDSIAFGGGQTPHRLGQTLKAMAVGCAVALSGGVFPVDGQFCTMSYSEIKFRRPITTKSWVAVSDPLEGLDAIRVTVESFDGTVVRGSFSGTLQPDASNAGSGPVTVQNGKFTIVVE